MKINEYLQRVLHEVRFWDFIVCARVIAEQFIRRTLKIVSQATPFANVVKTMKPQKETKEESGSQPPVADEKPVVKEETTEGMLSTLLSLVRAHPSDLNQVTSLLNKLSVDRPENPEDAKLFNRVLLTIACSASPTETQVQALAQHVGWNNV